MMAAFGRNENRKKKQEEKKRKDQRVIRMKKCTGAAGRWNKTIGQIWADPDGSTVLREKRSAGERASSFIKVHRWELTFVFLMGCLLFGLSWILPFNEAPDEAMRYLIPQYIYRHGTLPKGWEEEVRNKLWGISYAFQPYIPYMIGGYLMKLVGLFTDSEHALMMTARFVNIVIGMGFYWYVLQIGKKLFASRLFRTFFVALLAMLPQLLYIFTYVNTDGMAVFSSAMIIYYWLEGLEKKWNRQSCTGLAVAVAVCALSYFNAYGYALFSVFLFIGSMVVFYRRKGIKECGAMIVKRGLFIAVVVFLLAGWWFVRAAVLFDGDILGMKTSSKYGEMYAMDEYRPSERQSLQEQGVELSTMLKNGDEGGMDWFILTDRSVIGVFGYAKYIMGLDLYEIHKSLFLVGFVGILLHILLAAGYYLMAWAGSRTNSRTGGTGKLEKPRLTFENCRICPVNFCILQVSLAFCMVIPVILSIYYSYVSDFQPQGRYVMPMIVPLMYFTAAGMERFMTLFFRKWFVYPMMLLMFYAVLHVFLGAFVSLYIPTFVESLSSWADIRFPWFANVDILTKLLQAMLPG